MVLLNGMFHVIHYCYELYISRKHDYMTMPIICSLTRFSYTNTEDRNTDEMESEFLEVPVQLKGYVIGKGGRTINEIRQNSGARVYSLSKEEGGFMITGDEEQRTCAKRLIMEKVVSYDEEMSSKDAFLSICTRGNF